MNDSFTNTEIEQSANRFINRTQYRSSDQTSNESNSQVLNKLSEIDNLLTNQMKEMENIKNRFDKFENKILKSCSETVESIDQANVNPELELPSIIVNPNGEFNLEVEQLNEYNYSTWSKSIEVKLKKYNLHIFLFNLPKDNEVAKKCDQKVKDLILSTISLSYKSVINQNKYQFSKNLWDLIKRLFFDVYTERRDSNLNYITRSNVKKIHEVKNHITQFRTAANELKAIDLKFDENVLIELFLNTLANELTLFHSMIRQHVREFGFDYKKALNFAAAQSYYLLQIQHSGELIEIKDQQ